MKKISKISLMILSFILLFSSFSFAALELGEDTDVEKIIIQTEDPVKIKGKVEGVLIETTVDKAQIIIENSEGKIIERELHKDGKLEIEPNKEDFEDSKPIYQVRVFLSPSGTKIFKLFDENNKEVESIAGLPNEFILKTGKYEFTLEHEAEKRDGKIVITSSDDIKIDFFKLDKSAEED